MRHCALLLLLALTFLPAFAAKRVTVVQLEQTLTALQGKSDADIAHHLTDLELSERLSSTTLSRWESGFPGSQTRRALTLLANASEFLELPPAQIPTTPAPDHQTQRHIMAMTVDYVSRTIHQLPNLFATRVTAHFEDAPQGFAKGGMVFVPAQQMHFVGETSGTAVYRDGAEVVDTRSGKRAGTDAALHGLETSGEFGPILVTTLIDAAHSSLAWAHWENGADAPLAVFRYAVPAEKSHYEVSYCCVPNPQDTSLALEPFHVVSGYHGEIAVDATTGVIRRLTVQADLKSTDPLVRADIMVEYGPVVIAGSSYICPLHSVSISAGHALQATEIQHLRISSVAESTQYAPGHLQTLLNEVSFEQYHLFRADARMTASASPEKAGPAPSQASPQPTVPVSANTLSAAETSAPLPPVPRSEAANDPQPGAAGDRSASPSNAGTETAANPPPAAVPAASTAPAPLFEPPFHTVDHSDAPIFKARSEAVVVDVVVTKGKDEPVSGLAKQDFQVTEDGRPQPVDFFEEHAPSTAAPGPLPQMPVNVYTNQPIAPPGDSVNVLLLDSLNTPHQDQALVHQQTLNYLKNMDPGTRVAIFALGSKLRFIQGFTDDPALLRAALNDKQDLGKPDSSRASRTREDDVADSEEIKTLAAMNGGHTTEGLRAVQDAQSDAASYQADDRTMMTLSALRHIALYLAGIPGRKNLVWFASSFPVSVFPSAKEKQLTPAQLTNSQAIRATADLLTLSKVAIYPVSAEGIAMNHTVETQADLAGPVKGTMADFTDDNSARASNMAAMEQLAGDTGGEAIFNTNDVNKALARAIQNGSHYYTLVYTPTNKEMDGKYRRIEVRLDNAHYKLSYRRGYYADPAIRNAPAAGGAAISDEANGQPDPLRPLLNRGLPGATQVLYGVRVLPAAEQPAASAARAGGNDKLPGPLTRYSVDFLIRWTDVDLEPTPQDTHRGQIQVGVIAYARDGKPVNWAGLTLRMNLNRNTFAAIQRSGIPAHIEIDLPQQEVSLVTGIYDWSSGRAGTLEVPVNRLQAHAQPSALPSTPAKSN